MNGLVATLVILLLVVCPIAGNGQPAGAPVPVPASAFKGAVMTIPEWGFSVESPSRAWTWASSKAVQQVEGVTMTLTQFAGASPDESERFLISIVPPFPNGPMTGASAERFMKGISSTRVKRGWTIGPTTCAPWSAFTGGWRCAFSAETPERVEMYYVGYLVSTKHFYALQSLNPGTSEPRAFQTFARSFRLLE